MLVECNKKEKCEHVRCPHFAPHKPIREEDWTCANFPVSALCVSISENVKCIEIKKEEN